MVRKQESIVRIKIIMHKYTRLLKYIKYSYHSGKVRSGLPTEYKHNSKLQPSTGHSRPVHCLMTPPEGSGYTDSVHLGKKIKSV